MPPKSARKRKAPAKSAAKSNKKTKNEEVKDDNENEIEEIEEIENDESKDVVESKEAEKKVEEKEEKNTESKIDETKSAESASGGKPCNLKIASWNINGIRAWLDHNGVDFIKNENPDIFCCQETKCDKTKIPIKAEVKGYQSYWLSGDKQGYSGVGLLTKVKPIKVSYGINDKKFDSEGRVITAEYDNFILVNSYIPNSGRGLSRLSFRMEWEAAFLKYLKELDKQKPVIWTGDLNVAHNKIDIKNPDSNTKNAGFTQQERDCFSKVLSEGFIDSFRHLYPNKEGAYTFWSYFRSAREQNIGWRLDYFVLSERLKPNLVDSSMRSSQKGSDHCPIVLEMNF